jgi:collagenase-like PrtC family protease
MYPFTGTNFVHVVLFMMCSYRCVAAEIIQLSQAEKKKANKKKGKKNNNKVP